MFRSITLKLGKMRKAQDFTIYPDFTNVENNTEYQIQSDTYIARINKKTGEGVLAGPHSGGAYSHHLSAFNPKRQTVKLTAEQLEEIAGKQPKSGDSAKIGGVTFLTIA